MNLQPQSNAEIAPGGGHLKAGLASVSQGKLRSGILAPVAVALLVFVTAAGAANPASGDKRLAERLVVAKHEFPDNSWSRYGTAPKCLSRTGFAVTATARSSFAGGIYSGRVSTVSSVVTVLKTQTTATRYYHALVRRMSSCLRRYWRHMPKPPSVGPAHALAYPRYGDQSAAARLPLKNPYPYNPNWHKFTDDWIVVRTLRAVIADDFLAPLAGPDASKFNAQTEHKILKQQLARA
jgi:hypothetical protein